MIFEIIFLVVFLIGLGGAGFIVYKKLPVLLQLPVMQEGIKRQDIVKEVTSKIKTYLPNRMVLLKFLSKIRVYVLKIEKRIDNSLQKMRKKIHSDKQEEEKK